MHLNMANFFLQFENDIHFQHVETLFSMQNENLEDRLESWQFLGVQMYYSQNEKVKSFCFPFIF